MIANNLAELDRDYEAYLHSLSKKNKLESVKIKKQKQIIPLKK